MRREELTMRRVPRIPEWATKTEDHARVNVSIERTSDGSTIIHLWEPAIAVHQFEAVITAALTQESGSCPRQLVFDFGSVTELVAPWSLIFALLIRLSRQKQVRIRGLHGQPLGAAWINRHNAEVRRMMEPATQKGESVPVRCQQ